MCDVGDEDAKVRRMTRMGMLQWSKPDGFLYFLRQFITTERCLRNGDPGFHFDSNSISGAEPPRVLEQQHRV